MQEAMTHSLPIEFDRSPTAGVVEFRVTNTHYNKLLLSLAILKPYFCQWSQIVPVTNGCARKPWVPDSPSLFSLIESEYQVVGIKRASWGVEGLHGSPIMGLLRHALRAGFKLLRHLPEFHSLLAPQTPEL